MQTLSKISTSFIYIKNYPLRDCLSISYYFRTVFLEEMRSLCAAFHQAASG